MTPSTTLTIVAQDDDEFDSLVLEARSLMAPLRFERSDGNERKLTYQTSAVLSFACDPDALMVTLEFDTAVLNFLGVIDGREALRAAKGASLH